MHKFKVFLKASYSQKERDTQKPCIFRFAIKILIFFNQILKKMKKKNISSYFQNFIIIRLVKIWKKKYFFKFWI